MLSPNPLFESAWRKKSLDSAELVAYPLQTAVWRPFLTSPLPDLGPEPPTQGKLPPRGWGPPRPKPYLEACVQERPGKWPSCLSGLGWLGESGPSPPSRKGHPHASSNAVGWPKMAHREGVPRMRPRNGDFLRFCVFCGPEGISRAWQKRFVPPSAKKGPLRRGPSA